MSPRSASTRLRALGRAAAVSLAGTATPAVATLITFDDLPDGTVVTTQYAALGLTVQNGVIQERSTDVPPSPVVSPPNVLNDIFGPGLILRFSGDLPSLVSLNVTAFFEDRIYLTAYGAGGLIDSAFTNGWAGPDPIHNSTPAVPRELVTLSGTGITTLTIDAFYGRRGDISIDNLFLTPAAVAIAEPSALALLGLGLLSFAGLRMRRGERR